MSNLTKNQHYVWQHHLRAWTIGDMVYCKRMDRPNPFPTSPRNVAAGRFFYEFHELSADDLKYLEAVISQSSDKRLQEINRGWIESFQKTFAIRRQLDGQALDPAVRDRIENELRTIELMMGERFHGAMETQMEPLLDALRKGDVSFYEDESSANTFIRFLTFQYFRTAKLRDRMLAIRAPLHHDIARTWPVEAFIYATNVGASIARQRKQYRIILLKNGANLPFITSDQPVINLHNSDDDELDFYFPVSPDLAAIYTANRERYPQDSYTLGALAIENYNHTMFVQSHEQIFGNGPDYLKALSEMPKMKLS